jgi:hypothetical protein
MSASLTLTRTSFRNVSNVQFVKRFYIIFKIQYMNTLKLECLCDLLQRAKSMENVNCKQQSWRQCDFALHAHNQIHTNKQHRLTHTNMSKVKEKDLPVNIYKITNIHKTFPNSSNSFRGRYFCSVLSGFILHLGFIFLCISKITKL